MKTNLKILLFTFLFCGNIFNASADRGTFKKRSKIHLNINTVASLKNSIAFNLRSGLSYKGSTVLNHTQLGGMVLNNSIVSYKKGNAVYIIPYKQKVFIPSYNAATGYKLIIRP